jgi:PAS domain S-box-containing protein
MITEPQTASFPVLEAACLREVVQAGDEADLLDRFCARLVVVGGFAAAWVGRPPEPPDRSVTPIAGAGLPAGFVEEVRLTWSASLSGRGPAGRCLETGQRCEVACVADAYDLCPWLEAVLALGIQAAVAYPLRLQGEGVAALSVYAARPFEAGEVEVLAALADALAFGIRARRALGAGSATDSEVRERAELHETLFRNSPDAVVVHDGATILDCNPAAAELFGVGQPARLVGRPILELIHVEDRELIARRFQAVTETGEVSLARRIRLLRPGGAQVLAEVAGGPCQLRRRPAVQTIFRDLSERTRAEEERSRLVAALEASRDLVLLLGPDDRPLYVNRAGREALGLPPGPVPTRFPELVAPRDATRLARQIIPELLRQGAWGGELALRAREGREVVLVIDATAHAPVDGAESFVSIIGRDLTLQRSLEAQLHQAQKMESIGRLAGGVAHDFNNLLSVIDGYTAFALGGLREGDPLRADLTEIQAASRRAAVLTRQLLAFSRKQILEPRVLDLGVLLRGMEKLLERIIGEDVELRFALGAGVSKVRADPGQLEQVIMNLVVNARDALPDGGHLTVETANVTLDEAYALRRPDVRPGRYVRLAVSDDGCGMDAETQSRLFEPFFTTKSVGKGTGLGLAMVYGIVRQSGGFVWVYSEPGVGTTVKVYLPEEASGAHPVSQTRLPAVPRRGTETVLVVEDEEGVRKLTRRMLAAAGYTVLTAANGGEALLICEQDPRPIHLVLTDVIMPRMSGKELVDRLARVRPGIKVLYMSGYTDDAIVHHGVLDPGASFIGKPFAQEDLARKVREVLDGP